MDLSFKSKLSKYLILGMLFSGFARCGITSAISIVDISEVIWWVREIIGLI